MVLTGYDGSCTAILALDPKRTCTKLKASESFTISNEKTKVQLYSKEMYQISRVNKIKHFINSVSHISEVP